MQRFAAIIGILALAMTIMPSLPEALAGAPECCNGVMCPMHLAQKRAPNCDMDGKDSSAALQSCPVQAAVHYTAMTVFVLSAPLILQSDTATEASTPFQPRFSPDAERRIESPPPRFPISRIA
jgi:hypothetical protein